MIHTLRTLLPLPAIAGLTMLAGLAWAQEEGKPPPPSPREAPATPPGGEEKGAMKEHHGMGMGMAGPRPMTDGEILGKIREINQREIEMGRLAETRAMSKDVKSFGQRLVRDHQNLDKALTDESKRLNIAITMPEATTDMEKEMQAHHMAIVDKLKSLSGAEFDREFLNLMQAEHSRGTLILTEARERLTNKDLDTFIKTKVIPSFEDHRKMAIDLIDTTAKERGAPPS
jgi:putative membrane protein